MRRGSTSRSPRSPASGRAVSLGDRARAARPRPCVAGRGIVGGGDLRRRHRRLRRRRAPDPRAAPGSGDALRRDGLRRGRRLVPRRRAAGLVVRVARRVRDRTGRYRIAHTHAPVARPDPPVAGRRRARPVGRADRRAARASRRATSRTRRRCPARPDVVPLVRERFRSAALAGTRVNPFRQSRPGEPIRIASPVRRSRSATA